MQNKKEGTKRWEYDPSCFWASSLTEDRGRGLPHAWSPDGNSNGELGSFLWCSRHGWLLRTRHDEDLAHTEIFSRTHAGVHEEWWSAPRGGSSRRSSHVRFWQTLCLNKECLTKMSVITSLYYLFRAECLSGFLGFSNVSVVLLLWWARVAALCAAL